MLRELTYPWAWTNAPADGGKPWAAFTDAAGVAWRVSPSREFVAILRDGVDGTLALGSDVANTIMAILRDYAASEHAEPFTLTLRAFLAPFFSALTTAPPAGWSAGQPYGETFVAGNATRAAAYNATRFIPPGWSYRTVTLTLPVFAGDEDTGETTEWTGSVLLKDGTEPRPGAPGIPYAISRNGE